MPRSGRPWTEKDIALLIELRDVRLLKWPQIARALARSAGSCCVTHSKVKTGTYKPRVVRAPTRSEIESTQHFKLTDQHIAAREARRAAADRRSLTATFCGDPPPGYSALDQKRNASA